MRASNELTSTQRAQFIIIYIQAELAFKTQRVSNVSSIDAYCHIDVILYCWSFS
jgi:hypothetical protein